MIFFLKATRIEYDFHKKNISHPNRLIQIDFKFGSKRCVQFNFRLEEKRVQKFSFSLFFSLAGT